MAKVVAFAAEYGVSAELRGHWHRFSARVEVAVEDSDEPSEVMKKAWNTVISEVEKQVQEVITSLPSS